LIFSPDAVFFYLTVPSLIFPVGLAGVLIMLESARSGNNHTDVLSISLLIIAAAVIYDTGVRVGFFPTGIPISVFARFFVLFGVIIFLMRRVGQPTLGHWIMRLRNLKRSLPKKKSLGVKYSPFSRSLLRRLLNQRSGSVLLLSCTMGLLAILLRFLL
jgi:hypothetical protein